MKQKTVQIELPGETPTLNPNEKDLERINPENIETNSRFKADYDKANIISQATFWYGIKFAFKGYFSKNKSGEFDEKDLLTVPWRCRSDVLSDKFTYEMHKRKREKPMTRLNLVLAVMKTIKWPLLFIFVCETLTAFGRIFSAWVSKKLVEAYLDGNEGDAYMWSGVIAACLIFGCFVDHHWDYISLLYPTLVQNALVDLVYGKILKLSTHSITHISAGRLLNMATVNLTCLSNYGQFFVSLAVGICALIAGGAVIWQSFGVYTLIGLGYIVAWYPIHGIAILLSTKDRTMTDNLTNERVKTTSETVEAIRLLKMYTWEYRFKEKISNLRKKEVGFLKGATISTALTRGTSFSVQDIGTFLMFLAYYYTGHELHVADIFAAYFLFNQMRIFSSYYFGTGFIFAEEAHNVFKSIEKVLEAPEVGDIKFEKPRDPANSIEYENYSAFWETNDHNEAFKDFKTDEMPTQADIEPALKNINLNVKKGSVNALVGAVGSGKTSFLMSFTGEMPKTAGSLRYSGSIAYVEQEPTIFAGTFKESVCFGKPYDAERYKRAVEACNLVNDLRLFSKGDDAEIVGGGLNLSGGQKARLAFARAVYANADIYLLDDPLSAVDPKVAKSLYKNAIEGALKGKTIILVTHQVDYVKNCENIIVIENGKVLGSGTLEELQENGVHPEKIFGDDSHHKQNNSQADVSQAISMDEPELRVEPSSKHNIDHHRNDTVMETETARILKEGDDNDWNNEAEDKGIIAENKKTGQVTMKTYKGLLKEMGGLKAAFTLFGILVATQMTTVAYGRMLGAWVAGTFADWKTVAILGGLVGFSLFIYCVLYLYIGLSTLKASKRYHKKLLDKIVDAKVLFFDSNSVGSIVSRFSQDIGIVDKLIPVGSIDVLNVIAMMSMIVITTGIVFPMLLIPNIPVVIFTFLLIWLVYPSVERSKMFETKTKDPVFSLLSETLKGIVIVRMFKQEDNFKKQFREHLNRSNKGNYSFLIACKVAGFYAEFFFYLAAIACIFILTSNTLSGNVEPYLSALLIALILSISGLIAFGLVQFSTMNIGMASVARIQELVDVPSEPPQKLENDKLMKGWPSQGKIDMNKVYMKYRPDADFVIKNLNLNVKPGEKIGCVGRTGAGKSTIVQMLYRMREIDRKLKGGKDSYIKLDDVSTQSVGLNLLRTNISMIPQTPYIFSDTIRSNIDPLGQHTDQEIMEVLADVRLKDHIEKQSDGLNTRINGGSAIFSVGQKQLVCLARVVLKPAPVLIMDEATANMDHDTDNFLQEKIEQRFDKSTRFTIAHRLTTIANYDKILVLSKGTKVEFDEPYKLLVKNIGDLEMTNKEGHFSIMVQNTGPISSKQIFEIAKNAYFDKHNLHHHHQHHNHHHHVVHH